MGEIRSTTVLLVRRAGQTVMASDGQVTQITLGVVVVNRDSRVLEKRRQGLTLSLEIPESLAELALR